MTTCNKIYFKLKTVLKILSTCYKYNTVSTLSEMVSAVMELVMLWPDLTNLVMKWYLMCIWAGWLYPFKLGKTIWLICMHTLIWDLLLTDQTLVLDSASIEIYA